MGEPAIKLEEKIEVTEDKKLKVKLLETHTEELIIGLCGPIGTDVSFVGKSIEKIIKTEYGYQCRIITLSDFIKEKYPGFNFNDLKKKKKAEYYNKLIDCGNELREKNDNSVLAELAINEITVQREIDKTKSEKTDYSTNRRCYIIDSIKNGEELALFRLVYRDIFYFIGIFAALENRIRNLADRDLKPEEVLQLIERDSNEKKPNGQSVSDTFTEADFFLRVNKSSSKTVESNVRRFLNLIFNTDIITPSYHENAMYLAAAAAGNSACLSRQVGAAITDEKGDVISVGWNDVPKFGGGVYQFHEDDPTSKNDFRCMHLKGGICFNDKEKNDIVNYIVTELISNEVIIESKKEALNNIVAKSKINELIEFSRAVHAEMLAIIHGSQKTGQKMRNGKLYCTTYPCHNCARHIVAAGIKEVYYIEPYRKSLATKLHDDSITEDESKTNFVRILTYEGVSPRRYLELFKMEPDSRKAKGAKISFSTLDKMPKKTLSLQAIPILEKEITKDLIARNLIQVK